MDEDENQWKLPFLTGIKVYARLWSQLLLWYQIKHIHMYDGIYNTSVMIL